MPLHPIERASIDALNVLAERPPPLSKSNETMIALSGSMGQTMSHYAVLSAKSNAAAATLEVRQQQAEIIERKAEQEELCVRMLGEKMHSLVSMIDEKAQQASQLEQDIQAGERMAHLLEMHAMASSDQLEKSFPLDARRRDTLSQQLIARASDVTARMRGQRHVRHHQLRDVLARTAEVRAYVHAVSQVALFLAQGDAQAELHVALRGHFGHGAGAQDPIPNSLYVCSTTRRTHAATTNFHTLQLQRTLGAVTGYAMGKIGEMCTKGFEPRALRTSQALLCADSEDLNEICD
ncbi:hypothetical protein AB1Y20_013844 [Prymnesium parvum]|uniref:Uncharacterized protein n=1 Tax=Prymnesium parvum TaxID=97485 RepID=A0AB34IHH5_PRYPA